MNNIITIGFGDKTWWKGLCAPDDPMDLCRGFAQLPAVCCNQMGTVFVEMSSWAALSWYAVTKKEVKTKNIKIESSRIFITKILNFKSD